MNNDTPSSVIGIIPARWGSSRFPGKPLHLIAGKSLIQRVYEQTLLCQKLEQIIIATDHVEIAEAAEAFGASVVMTREDHPTGSDRIAEVLETFSILGQGPSHVINIQGDEPLIDPALIDQLAEALLRDSTLPLVTAASPLDDPNLYSDPNVVKVVLNKNHEALYFSRSPLPFYREGSPASASPIPAYRHIGIYGYRSDFLREFLTLPPSPLEKAESLEQLRALENGHTIKVILTDDVAPGVDTLEQAQAIEQLILSQTTSS